MRPSQMGEHMRSESVSGWRAGFSVHFTTPPLLPPATALAQATVSSDSPTPWFTCTVSPSSSTQQSQRGPHQPSEPGSKPPQSPDSAIFLTHTQCQHHALSRPCAPASLQGGPVRVNPEPLFMLFSLPGMPSNFSHWAEPCPLLRVPPVLPALLLLSSPSSDLSAWCCGLKSSQANLPLHQP